MLPKGRFSGFGVAILDKKTQQNPKYKDVKPVIDSGTNVKKYVDSLKEFRKSNPYKPDEVFKRVKLSTFVRLVIEVSEAQLIDDPIVDFGGTEMTPPKTISKDDTEKASEPLSPFQGVLFGIGEWDRKQEQNKDKKSPSEKQPHLSLPYLLLDVRDAEAYNSCHIITARNYPSTMLLRSPGYETKDLLHFKNISKKLIILYDEEESVAIHVATTLVQRGYDNIFVLCGGLKSAQEKFPRGLINGFLLHPQMKKNSMETTSSSSSSDLKQRPFHENFTEDDLRILKLTSEMLLTATQGTSKLTSSYGTRSITSQKTSNPGCARPSTDGIQSRQSSRKAQSSSSKLRPWR